MYCQHRIATLENFEGFTSWGVGGGGGREGGENDEKHSSTDRNLRPCSFHHEIYKTLFVLGRMQYSVVRCK